MCAAHSIMTIRNDGTLCAGEGSGWDRLWASGFAPRTACLCAWGFARQIDPCHLQLKSGSTLYLHCRLLIDSVDLVPLKGLARGLGLVTVGVPLALEARGAGELAARGR